MNTKYGNNDYKISSNHVSYSFNQLLYTHSSNTLRVSTPLLDNKFEVDVNEYDSRGLEDISENFVEKYYDEKINKSLEEYDSSARFYVYHEERIPNSLGHIPSLDELISYESFDGMTIFVSNDSGCSDSEKGIDYIKNVSLNLLEVLDYSNAIDIKYHFRCNFTYHYNYFSSLSDTNLIITTTNGGFGDEKNTYEYNIEYIKKEIE